MPEIPVDLRTASRVRIGNQWQDIEPGTFVVGKPVFTMVSDEEDTDCFSVWGGGYHPLSYFFTDANGHPHTGPYHHVQQMQYGAEPEPQDEASSVPDHKHEFVGDQDTCIEYVECQVTWGEFQAQRKKEQA